jgi:hypothetical protein
MAAEPVDEPLADDDTRLVAWAGPAFILFSLVLVPWTIYLGFDLPDRQESSHYNIAWVGFDVMLLVVLAATGFLRCDGPTSWPWAPPRPRPCSSSTPGST